MTKILVVDDSVSVRDVVERALASDETQVVSAASGIEAIEQIEREHPDLVVCDVRMPDRDGYEICRFVKSHPELGRTPVLLISGTVNSTVLAEAARVRSDDVLGKPFHMNELLRRVNDLLGSELEPERGSAAGRLRGGPAVELSAALTQLGTLPGVSWAALADPEGFLIDSVGEPGPLAETSAALVSWLGESCASIGRELGRGALHGVAVEYGHGTLFLQSVGISATLIVLVDGPDSLGEVRHWARKMLPELGRGDRAPMLSSGRSPALSVGLAAVVATLYGFLMASLFVLRIGVTLMLPTWTMWAAPVALYAFLTLVSVTGVPILKRLAVFATLCAVYAGVAALTGCLVVAVSGLDYVVAVTQASSRFMPAPLLQLFAVPMLLLPFRSLLTERPRPSQGRPKSQPERAPSRPLQEAVPGWEGTPRLDALRPDAASAGLAFAARRPAASPVAPSVAVEPNPVVDEALPAEVETSVPIAPDEGARGSAPLIPASVEPAIEPPVEPVLTDESVPGTSVAPEAEEVVAIPFGRVESQLPADLFSGPVAEIAAGLEEPGHLLVPIRVVLPQLAEGLVTVRWDEVASQFPAEAFAGAAFSVAERLAAGRLVLPLDELVRRLPPDVFALSVAAPDVSALESFPLPFQPVGSAAGDDPVAEPVEAVSPPLLPVASELAPALAALRLATARIPEPVREHVEGVSLVASPFAAEAPSMSSPADVQGAPIVAQSDSATSEIASPVEPPAPPPSVAETFEPVPLVELGVPLSSVAETFGPTSVVEPLAPPPTMSPALPEAAEPGRSIEAPLAQETPPLVASSTQDVPSGPGIAETAPVVEPPAPGDSIVSRSAGETSIPTGAEPRLDRLAGALSPLGALMSSVTELAGATVYVFRAPSVPVDGVMQIAATALPLLGVGPTPVEQLTLRLEHGALVLTPLASIEPGPTLLVASSPRNGSLAMLEMLSLRARPSDVSRSAAPRLDRTTPVEELDPMAGGPAADLLAGALRGFGAFRPTVLRDPAGRLELCLLQAPGDDVRAIGSFAHAACCALSPATVGGALGAVQSAVFRLGPRRLALRPFEGRPGHWIALCTPGDGARPGLVHLEMERAAAHAGAR